MRPVGIGSWPFAAVIAVGCGVLASAGCAPSPIDDRPASSVPAQPLRLGEDRAAHLPPGGALNYSLDLETGEAALVVVKQVSVDVAIEVFDPAGALRLTFDSPARTHVSERLCFTAEASGTHRLRLIPFGDYSGELSIRLERRRRASAGDEICQAASATLMAAVAARGQGLDSEALLRQYEAARDGFRQAREPLLEALALLEMGRLFAGRRDYSQAIESYELALAVARPLGSERFVVTLLNALGGAGRAVGEIEAARGAFEAAAELARRVGRREAEATALNELGRLAAEQGDAHLAAALYRQALEIWRLEGNRAYEAVTLHNLAESYQMLERFAEARDLLDEALARAREVDWQAFEASVLTTLAWSRLRDDSPREAVDLLEQALRLRQDAGDLSGQAGVLDRLGSAQLRLGQLEPALASYQASLEIASEIGNPRYAARTRVNLGCLQVSAGQLEQAVESLDAALEYLASHHDPTTQANALFCRAQAERRLGDLPAAREHLETALRIVDSLRTTARRQGVWHGAIEDWQDYAELYVTVLYELSGGSRDSRLLAAAFEASDLARARTFYELLFEAGLGVRSDADATLLAQEGQVRAQLDEVAARLSAAAGEEPGELARRSRQLALELATLQDQIRLSSPRFDPLLNPPGVALEEFQSLLGPDDAVLSYSLGKERGYLFAVTRDSIVAHALPARATIEATAARAYDGLRHSVFSRGRQRADTATGELSEMLLAPVRERLTAGRLLVIVEGMLHYIPFAALPWPGGEGLLVDRAAVVHLPSAAVLSALRTRSAARPTPAKDLAVLADAVFSPLDPRVEGGGTAVGSGLAGQPTGGEEPFQRLVHTRREAESILALVPPELRLEALDFAASGELARSEELSRYRMIHLASHALINEEIPELSEIVMSLVDAAGRPVDGGRLRLHEIYGLQFSAELVVLSACRTALGKRVRGDGLQSFTRGFFHAGASRVLVSLWDVGDAASADLIARFYHGLLAEDLPPAEALRRAQLWMRQQPAWEAPFHWAGFVLHGEPD